jgi:hypothetical protein
MTFVVLWWDYYSWMLFCSPSVWEMMNNGIYFVCLTFYGLYTCLLKTIKFWKHIAIFILTWAPCCYALPMMMKWWWNDEKKFKMKFHSNENTEWHFMQSFELNSNSLELDLLNSNLTKLNLDSNLVEEKWDANWCKKIWNFSYHFHHLWLWCWKKTSEKSQIQKDTFSFHLE